ncbi:MAG: hypothetical protein ACRC37_02085 [Lentisphaeria bacterium]
MARGYELKDCHYIDEIFELGNCDELQEELIPIESLFSHLNKLQLDDVQENLFRNGVKLNLSELMGKFFWG